MYLFCILQPSLDDGLPGKICSQCVYKCISWDSFKQLCERTESMLRTQLNISPPNIKHTQNVNVESTAAGSQDEVGAQVDEEEQSQEATDTSRLDDKVIDLVYMIDVLDEQDADRETHEFIQDEQNLEPAKDDEELNVGDVFDEDVELHLIKLVGV